jgi:hypothetical protein
MHDDFGGAPQSANTYEINTAKQMIATIKIRAMVRSQRNEIF